MWDLIVSVPDRCLSFYLEYYWNGPIFLVDYLLFTPYITLMTLIKVLYEF